MAGAQRGGHAPLCAALSLPQANCNVMVYAPLCAAFVMVEDHLCV